MINGKRRRAPEDSIEIEFYYDTWASSIHERNPQSKSFPYRIGIYVLKRDYLLNLRNI